MKILNSAPKFLIYTVFKVVRHPRTPVTYYQCKCGCRFTASEKECPKCGDKIENSPESKSESPVPWWGCILCIGIGIGAWIAGASLEIAGLDEAGRALVYIPLGSLFGMSIQRG